jgi:hypothetical protein
MTATREGRYLTLHVITLTLLTLFYAALYRLSVGAPDAGPESAVGLLLAYVPLMVLGLPWSCALWVIPDAVEDLGALGFHLFIVGPAWINFALHAVRNVVRTARSLDPPETPKDPAVAEK